MLGGGTVCGCGCGARCVGRWGVHSFRGRITARLHIAPDCFLYDLSTFLPSMFYYCIYQTAYLMRQSHTDTGESA